ncbi:NAD dependent epimerase/dehydratase [Suillus fuscotomentosus]|uniref:NAD dependent epimerase/dehydratase n=1 Tax=Suillus fuscotomentosus TaxID=1912939 RepID=A0AAD4HPW2_9AGAM|nr:NAD dependent epimerase/dehydratase [Suillus fuscotomentosus]KAG1903179.1 NAD dependent epimerase/dehydratase [Suillus fuscotomentosus]
MSGSKIVVTGASGVLGTAVHKAFEKALRCEVVGLKNKSTASHLVQLDLTDKEATKQKLEEIQPTWVIHCAAERRPDVAEKDPVGTQLLNVEVPGYLAELAKAINFTLVYISTDYVFDGRSPPPGGYTPELPTSPLQIYGQTKRDGETAVLQARQQGSRAVVLRVPVLYGPAPNNADSAVNILVDVVQDRSKESNMDDYGIRYPTNVLDIASFLVRLTDISPDTLPPILHYSANESFTKYQMCKIFADILGLNDMNHIKPVSTPPTGAGATSRPYNCHLSTAETEKLLPLECTGFRTWWEEYLHDGGK